MVSDGLDCIGGASCRRRSLKHVKIFVRLEASLGLSTIINPWTLCFQSSGQLDIRQHLKSKNNGVEQDIQ